MTSLIRIYSFSLLAIFTTPVLAAPILIGFSDLDAGLTLIDFSSAPDDTNINTFYASQGVTFENLWSASYPYLGPSFGNTAVNFEGVNNECPVAPYCEPVTLTFDPYVTQVGFVFVSNAGTSTFEVNGVAFDILTSPPSFIGFEDTSGISSIVITAAGSQPFQPFVMDNLRFGSVPEPHIGLLLSLGLLTLSIGRRRAYFAKHRHD